MAAKYIEQLSDAELLDLHKKCADSSAIKIANRHPWKQDYLIFVVNQNNKNTETAKGYIYCDFYAPVMPLSETPSIEDASFTKNLSFNMIYRKLMTQRFGFPYALDLLNELSLVSKDDIEAAYKINGDQTKPVSLKSILMRGKK